MGFALSTMSGLFAPLQGLIGWFVSPSHVSTLHAKGRPAASRGAPSHAGQHAWRPACIRRQGELPGAGLSAAEPSVPSVAHAAAGCAAGDPRSGACFPATATASRAASKIKPRAITPFRAGAAASARLAAARPLRVVRVVDGRPASGAGRMVISGRMAEVCAELDRLAAHESRIQVRAS